MQSARIPDHLLRPGEKILHSIGCREDGTFYECALLFTRQFVYVVGNFLMKENCRPTYRINGFKVIDLNSVNHIKEINTRYPVLLVLCLIFLSAFFIFDTGYQYIYNLTILPPSTGILLYICSTIFFILYLLIVKRNIRMDYKEGYVQFRKRHHETGSVQNAGRIIYKYKNCNIILED